MFLKALYDYAKRAKTPYGAVLMDSLEFESRYVAWLIDITADGTLKGFLPLVTDTERGRLFPRVPRTVEPKESGTTAEFLVDDMTTILGIGESPASPQTGKACEKHESFWCRVQTAASNLNHPGLLAVIRWKDRYLGRGEAVNVTYEPYTKKGSKGAPKEQWIVTTNSGERKPLHAQSNAANDATFRVDGQILLLDEAIRNWWTESFEEWLATRERECIAAHGGGRVCILTGQTNCAYLQQSLAQD